MQYVNSEKEEIEREQIIKSVIEQLIKSQPKGIFLLDDPAPAIALRLTELKLTNKLSNRKLFYSIFISNINNRYISGVSVSQEVYENYYKNERKKLEESVRDRMLIGIRMDMGIVPINYVEGNKKECFTEGLQYLPERLEQLKEKQIAFTRWRSVYTVSKNVSPTLFCITQNTKAIAKFARASQSFGMVPIAEVELLKLGNYTLELGSKALETILVELCKDLINEDVLMEGVVIEVGVVSGGEGLEENCSVEEIAEATLNPLKVVLPTGLGGVAISSGGLSEEQATLVLNSIVHKSDELPWPITFAFGRALQHSAFKSWGGNEENRRNAEEEFERRQEANTRAMSGFYTPMAVQTSSSTDSLYEDPYIY